MAVRKKELDEKNNYYSRYYTAGNTAPEFLPWEEQILPKKKVKIVKKTRTVKKPKEEVNRGILYAVKAVFTVALVAFSCIMITALNSVVLEKEREIRTLNNQLKEMQETNLILETDIAEQVDLKYVKEEAIQRLGMKEPENYQIIYVDVPKASYTVQSREVSLDDEKENYDGLLEYICDLLVKVFG